MHRAAAAQGETGLASVLQRIRAAFAPILADLDGTTLSSIDAGAFRAGQISATIQHTPYMMAGNLLAASAFSWVAWDQFDRSAILAWAAALVLPSLYLLVTALPRRKRLVKSASPRALRRAEFYAIILGMVWAAFPALFFATAPADLGTLIIAMVLAACGCGAFALARIPSAGIIFTLITGVAMALTSLHIGGSIGILFALMALIYSMIMMVSIVSTHHAALERAISAARVERQREIITLLLHDFESGASDWLWETSRDGRLIYFSERMAEVLNRGRDRLLGATLPQAAGAAQSHQGWAELHRLMEEQRPVSDLTIEIPGDKASRWWKISARPLYDSLGAFTGYRGVGRDVTREHRSRQELLLAKEAAERASAAKSRFLAVMSHELKTPLNAIIGFAEIISAGPDGNTTPAQQADYARIIVQSSTHLRGLISDILDMTRLEQGTLAIVDHTADIVEIAELAIRSARDLARSANVELVLHYDRNGEVTGDLNRLKQAIGNIVTNAVKFSPQDGTVDIEIDRTEKGGLGISIRDRGVGIDPSECERMFEPFVQFDEGNTRRFGGLGLGLAIARRIARLHGGDLTLDSLPGSGTTARLTLPPSRIAWYNPHRDAAVA
jgi:hypothetical protein